MNILYVKYIIWITSDWFYIVYDNILILVCAMEVQIKEWVQMSLNLLGWNRTTSVNTARKK